MISNLNHSLWLLDYSVFSYIFFIDFYSKEISKETEDMSDGVYIASALIILCTTPGVILASAMLQLKVLIFDQNYS
jgi:hypothetical protein